MCFMIAHIRQLERDEDYAVDILKVVLFSVSLQLSHSTMTSTQHPAGIYHIVVAGGVEPEYLTRQEERATILPPSGQPDQEVIRRIPTSSVCLSLVSIV